MSSDVTCHKIRCICAKIHRFLQVSDETRTYSLTDIDQAGFSKVDEHSRVALYILGCATSTG